MSDEELALFLGIHGDDDWRDRITEMSPKLRVIYEKMNETHKALALYTAGKGPKPKGIFIDGPRHRKTNR